MRAPVIFEDLVAWAIRKLTPWLPGVAVNRTIDEPEKAPTVWVAGDGGPRDGPVRESYTLRVRTFADTYERSHDLARETEALLVASIDGDPVVQLSRISGPSDVTEKGARYVQLLQIFSVVAHGKNHTPGGTP